MLSFGHFASIDGENVGFSKANNQGVAVAKGEYVLILNPDTVVGENLFDDPSLMISRSRFGLRF